MKKFLALILAGMMAVSLCACDNASEVEEPTGEPTEDVVEKVNMVYGDDETPITLSKPADASFAIGAEEALDAGDLVILIADDFSWDAEIMGYKYYEEIGSNVPFVDYYFAGSVNEEEYASYEETASDLGIDYNGNPVKAIRYTFKEVDDEEETKECFVGFEYEGAADKGLFGVKIGAFEADLSDSALKALFNELFFVEK